MRLTSDEKEQELARSEASVTANSVFYAVTAGRDALKQAIEKHEGGQYITDDDFARLSWPDQRKVLDELNNHACAQSGRTFGEAAKKRAPIERRMGALQAINDAQWSSWIAKHAHHAQNDVDEPNENGAEAPR